MNNEKNVPEPESQKPLSILSLVNLSNDVLNDSAILTERAVMSESVVRLGQFADDDLSSFEEAENEPVKLPHEQLESILFCLKRIQSNMCLVDSALLEIRKLAIGPDGFKLDKNLSNK